MNKLNIKLVNQEKNSMDCTAACMSMVLSHYGVKKEIDDIKKEMKISKEGTYSPQAGIYFLDKGFDVEIISFNPYLFTNYHKNLSQKKILEHLKENFKDFKNKEFEKSLNFYIQFLEKGGKIKIEIPSLRNIKESIENNFLVVVGTTSIFLTKKQRPFFNLHDVLVTGFSKDKVFVNNPAKEKKISHKIEDFLFAVHSSSYACSDNGNFLVVKNLKNKDF